MNVPLEPVAPINEDQWEPVIPDWTPCEERDDPDSWDAVNDEPFDGDYHDPEAADDAD